MNTPVRRLSMVMLVMFLALMVSATWVQFVQAPDLNSDSRNVRTLYREFGTDRGPIVVGGEAVAMSTEVNDSFGFQRQYPFGELYAPVTGFYSVVYRQTGLEYTENELLNGTSDSLFLSRLQDLITGRQPQGGTVELTIDPVVQQAAWDALGDQTGAVVAIDPQTGAILAMVSKPTFDPSLLAGHNTAEVNANYQALLADPADPLVNRAIAGDTYPPGSTFKILTAAAALESGDYQSDTELDAPQVLSLPLTSATIGNYGGVSCSSTDRQTLADALRISCNTAFAQLGMDLGEDALRAQAEAFGFDAAMAIPLAVTQSRFPAELDAPQTAMAAIGQQSVRVTPLQVAMISATIANGGEQMAPYLVRRTLNSSLDIVSETTPSLLRTSISEATATALRDMMVAVVQRGTGTGAQIAGVTVAGKTGTAETGQADEAPHAWFTGFAPAEDPQVAVAVIVEHGGSLGSEATGGRIAAPIARQVMEAALR